MAIAVVHQATATDCGAACLAMVLQAHGRYVTLKELRDEIGYGRDGVSAQQILDAARDHGLEGQGISLEIAELSEVPLPAILHWEFSHYVVLERLQRGTAVVLDPGRGRRRVSAAELGRSFTGVVLALQPGVGFQRRARTTSYLRTLWTMLGEVPALGRILLMSLVLQLVALGTPLLSGALVDRVAQGRQPDWTTVCLVGFVSVAALHFLAMLVRAQVVAEVQARLDLSLTTRFVTRLLDLPVAFFQGRGVGFLSTRLTSLAAVRDLLTSSVVSACFDGGMAAMYLTVIAWIDPWLCLITMALGGLRVLVLVTTQAARRALMQEQLEAQTDVASYQSEFLGAMELIKATAREGTVLQEYRERFLRQVNASLGAGRLEGWAEAAGAGLAVASPLVIMWLTASAVMRQEISLGTMVMTNALAAGFLAPLAALVGTTTKVQLASTHVERLDEVFRSPLERKGGTIMPSPLRGEIELKGVSFAYAAGSSNAVRDVTLRVAAGSKIAIVGASGAGKSTLARLLVGLYVPNAGSITIDGFDLGTLDLRSLRRQVGVVTQVSYLLPGSIRKNIALGGDGHSLAEIEAAARMAELHDDIQAMPMAYDTYLGGTSVGLSGGQVQRLALARALLAQPRLLLLDEASSALDASMERRIFDTLRGLRCTQVVVAHRLSTVRDADLIVVLRDGHVAERGTHQELMAAGGDYAALVASQLSVQSSNASPPGTAC